MSRIDRFDCIAIEKHTLMTLVILRYHHQNNIKYFKATLPIPTWFSKSSLFITLIQSGIIIDSLTIFRTVWSIVVFVTVDFITDSHSGYFSNTMVHYRNGLISLLRYDDNMVYEVIIVDKT